MLSQMRALIVFVTAFAAPALAGAQPVPLDRFRACLAIEDMTKERLDCFDAVVRPEPKPLTAKPIAIADCRFYREQDQRLLCFNGFLASRPPSIARPIPTPAVERVPAQRFRPCHDIEEMTKERLDCFDAITPPAPRAAFTAQPKSIFECRYYREEDDRLRCYVNFTARLFKSAARQIAQQTSAPPRVQLPSAAPKKLGRSRGGCGSRGGAGYRTASGRCASRKR
jgi:hypothetical protein